MINGISVERAIHTMDVERSVSLPIAVIHAIETEAGW